MKKLRFVVPVLALGLMAAACGGGSGDSGNGGGGGGGEDGGTTSGALTMVDNEFQPSTLTAASGDTLEVTNDGAASHTFTLEDNSIDETVTAGSSASITISADPGSYGFACSFHPEMTGTLTVE